MSDNICDRCKKPVKTEENVMELLAIVQDDPLLVFTNDKCRHIRCSPSSAQWINHPDFMPMTDKRPKYAKKQYSVENRKVFEKKFTSGWLKLIGEDNLEDSTINLMNLD